MTRDIGPIAKPKIIVRVPELPKTRSGKILRRLLAQLWQGDPLGDTTSLQNPWAVDGVRDAIAQARQVLDPTHAPHQGSDRASHDTAQTNTPDQHVPSKETT